MRSRFGGGALAACAAVAAAGAAPPDARYLGLDHSQGRLAVAGEELVLAPGARTPAGHRLLMAGPSRAWLRAEGRTWVLTIGAAPVELAGEATLRADHRGRFRSRGRVNGSPLEIEVDPSAPFSLLSAGAGRRLGIVVDRRRGQRIALREREVLAFPARLGRLELDRLVADDVPVLVVDDRRIEAVRLGADFLAHLASVERDGSWLVLGQ
jgi:hypothetical protein